MDTTKTARYTLLFAGLAVVGHAVVDEQYCVGHPHAYSCHNPIAPGPDLPHEWMNSTSSVSTGMASVIVRYY